MQNAVGAAASLLAAGELPAWVYNTIMFVKVLIGFSLIIFVHELGHFLAAKWVGVRVDRFAVGFGTRLVGYRRGEGLTFGNRPEISRDEVAQRGWGETDYCIKALPFGGYVKMLGQEDIIIDDNTGDVRLTNDPRAFTNRTVGQRMVVVSAGVIFNVLFAALLLMTVFLVGKSMPSPVIGMVPPDSSAAGKILPGDRVLKINDDTVLSFVDIKQAAALSDGPLRFTIERDGKTLPEPILVQPERDPSINLASVDFSPFLTTRRTREGDPVGNGPNLLAGDVITHIDGEPVDDGLDVLVAFQNSRGRVLKLTVRREDPDRPASNPKEVVCPQRGTLVIDPADPPGERPTGAAALVDNSHLLGFMRRRAINLVEEGGAADRAGLKRGDVIEQWGGVPNPTYEEILESVTAEPVAPIPVVVSRGGELHRLSVTPKRPFRLFSAAKPRVGVDFAWRGEEDRAVVAAIAPGTPAAELGMPRGSQIVSIDGTPVESWFDVSETLQSAAGRSVTVRYRSGADEADGVLHVPSSVVNELGLPASARIHAVDGQRSVKTIGPDGRERELTLPGVYAVRKLLAERVGKTVTIRFVRQVNGPIEEARFAVRAENVDPWQMRVQYIYDPFGFEVMTEVVTAGGNPFVAMAMGVDSVARAVRQIYATLTQMAKQNVGVEHVSGPVGIVSIAMEQARQGLSELFYFLAVLSLNLAVINFMPLPVMDGGLMLFLIIEKIKGKPLSFKTQMVSTLVGLAAIILIGLVVTIQDISRFF